jgi:PAS domain S-box-containing protein
MTTMRLRPRVPSLRSFKEWVVYLVILDLLVVTLAAISIGHGRLTAENNAFIDAQNAAKLLTQNLRAVFDKFDVSLVLLKEAAEQRDIRRDAAAIDAAATRIFGLHPELEYLRLADADGNVFLGTGRSQPAQINVATREYFKTLRDNPDAGLVFSEPLQGYGSGIWSIVLARRFGNASAPFSGVVFAVLRLDWIQNQFAAINLGTKGAISLRALDLSTVARYPTPASIGIKPGDATVTPEWREKLAQNPNSGLYTAVSPDGLRRSLAYSRVGPYPFYVVAGLWPGDYLDEWQRDVAVTGMLAAIVIVVSALIARAWHRRDEDTRRIAELQNNALIRSQQQLDVAAESAGLGTWVTNLITGEMTASPRGRSLFGLSADAALDYGLAVARISTDDQVAVRSAFERCAQHGEPLDVRFRVFCADESSVHWLEVRGQRLTGGMNGQMVGIVQDITSDVTYLDALRSAKIDAEAAARSLSASESQLRELTQNLEARVRDEVAAREAAQTRLAHSERMQAVGHLTGGIAHDFNNLLTVITGTIDCLEHGVADRPQLVDIVRMIAAATERGARLTASLLAFARKQPLRPRQTDIGMLLMETCSLLRSTIGRQIEIDLIEHPETGCALVDPDQLGSAIVNLAINARDAMPEGGSITVEADTTTIDEPQAKSWEVAAGRYVVISVRDTGAGIPRQIQDKVFEPFFTTKEVGKGTGLGLSIVFGFVKQSGGHVDFTSAEGVGTTFRIYLPAMESVVSPATRASVTDRSHSRSPGETVLCVEDDPSVRDMVMLQLSKLGYTPIMAVGPDEAMTYILNPDLAIDLLFTDIVMPGKVNGWQFAEAARRGRPGLKVVYTSGYSDHGAPMPSGDPSASMLKKPYRLEELGRILRQAIDA